MKDKKENLTLRELREINEKSREEIARILGVTVSAVTNYEIGIRRISLEQVLILATNYNMPAEEIILAQLESIAIRNPD